MELKSANHETYRRASSISLSSRNMQDLNTLRRSIRRMTSVLSKDEEFMLKKKMETIEQRIKTGMEKTSRRESMDNKDEANDKQQTTNYVLLKNQSSTDVTSTSTLQTYEDDFEAIETLDDLETSTAEIDHDGASTSYDAKSLQFDESSIAPSEDISVYCAKMKKPKKTRSKEEQQLRDFDMWKASNIEVMQNLLNRSGSLDDRIKWEAIATARGLCTLRDNCACGDCARNKVVAGMIDGDGGMGAFAPVAVCAGCCLQ